MKYYKTWQEAFIEFVKLFGHQYSDSYNLAAEFEEKLGKNIKGVYFMYIGENK
jgi:hypothetical protein